jgi:hypothetical protein
METEKMLNAMCELLPVQRNRLSHRKAKFLVVARAGDNRLAHTKQIPRSRSAFTLRPSGIVSIGSVLNSGSCADTNVNVSRASFDEQGKQVSSGSRLRVTTEEWMGPQNLSFYSMKGKAGRYFWTFKVVYSENVTYHVMMQLSTYSLI